MWRHRCREAPGAPSVVRMCAASFSASWSAPLFGGRGGVLFVVHEGHALLEITDDGLGCYVGDLDVRVATGVDGGRAVSRVGELAGLELAVERNGLWGRPAHRRLDEGVRLLGGRARGGDRCPEVVPDVRGGKRRPLDCGPDVRARRAPASV